MGRPTGEHLRYESRPARETDWVRTMESGEFLDNPCEGNDAEPERSKLLVRRAAYRRFSRWMDEQLKDLVIRWAHIAAPNAQRLRQPLRRRNTP